MRYVILLILIINCGNIKSQSKVKKLSASIQSNFYTYGEGRGSLNNVVRLAEGLSFTYKTYDTVKGKGMIYEFVTNTTSGYYKNVLSSNSVLEVNDIYTNLNFIFPLLILHTSKIEHCLGAGFGVGTLAGRDYLDENNNVIPYNSTTFKQLNFGKYWTSSFMLDYELDLKFSKRIGVNLGLRYTTATPINSGKSNYIITQGTGISFKYGLFYQFK